MKECSESNADKFNIYMSFLADNIDNSKSQVT